MPSFHGILNSYTIELSDDRILTGDLYYTGDLPYAGSYDCPADNGGAYAYRFVVKDVEFGGVEVSREGRLDWFAVLDHLAMMWCDDNADRVQYDVMTYEDAKNGVERY
jgi:hypothetical protein